jgi:hypothetical protein
VRVSSNRAPTRRPAPKAGLSKLNSVNAEFDVVLGERRTGRLESHRMVAAGR